MFVEDFARLDLAQGANVIVTDHGETADMVIVQTEASIELAAKIDELLTLEDTMKRLQKLDDPQKEQVRISALIFSYSIGRPTLMFRLSEWLKHDCYNVLIHSADPQSRPVVIGIFILVCPYVPTFQNCAKQNKF